jgi:hypothetical protein
MSDEELVKAMAERITGMHLSGDAELMHITIHVGDYLLECVARKGKTLELTPVKKL